MRINGFATPSEITNARRKKNPAPYAYLADLHCDMSFATDDPPSQSNFAEHTHQTYELLYFVRGDAEYNIEGRVFRLQPHDLLFIQPKQPHYLHVLAPVPYERYVSNFDAHVLPTENRRQLDALPYLTNIENKPFLRACFERLRPYSKTFSDPDMRLMIRCSVREILLNLLYEDSNSRESYTQSNHTLGRIIALIEKNPERDWNAENLSRELYLSKSYIQNIFSQYMGIGLKSYINTKKILYAQSLLLAGDSPAVACQACGFRDYSTFYRLFRKVTGSTPISITKDL